MRENDLPKRKHCRLASFSFVEKGKARGLEASDFVAWQWNKYYADTLAVYPPRNIRKDVNKFLQLTDDKLKVYLFTGAGLERVLLEHGCTREW